MTRMSTPTRSALTPTLSFTPGTHDAALHLAADTAERDGVGLCGSAAQRQQAPSAVAAPCATCVAVALDLGWTAARSTEKSWVNLARLHQRVGI